MANYPNLNSIAQRASNTLIRESVDFMKPILYVTLNIITIHATSRLDFLHKRRESSYPSGYY